MSQLISSCLLADLSNMIRQAIAERVHDTVHLILLASDMQPYSAQLLCVMYLTLAIHLSKAHWAGPQQC